MESTSPSPLIRLESLSNRIQESVSLSLVSINQREAKRELSYPRSCCLLEYQISNSKSTSFCSTGGVKNSITMLWWKTLTDFSLEPSLIMSKLFFVNAAFKVSYALIYLKSILKFVVISPFKRFKWSTNKFRSKTGQRQRKVYLESMVILNAFSKNVKKEATTRRPLKCKNISPAASRGF